MDCNKTGSCENHNHDTTVSLREYIEAKFISNDKALALALDNLNIKLAGMDRAVSMDKVALDKRLEGMNEFRNALKDQQVEFIRRPEHAMIVADVRSLRDSRATLEGKADQGAVTISTGIAITGVCLAVLNLLIFWLTRGH
jgi:hypothetical protein